MSDSASTVDTLPGVPRKWQLRQFDEEDLVFTYDFVGQAWRFWWKPWKWNILYLALKARYYIRQELNRRLHNVFLDVEGN
jgi:hypothetical protein